MLTRPPADDLLDLTKYKPKPQDGAVVGWPEHKKPKENKMEFKVAVRSLKAKEEATASQSASETATRDEL